MAQKKESFFWTSYSDFMTSLFFVMLTLVIVFVVVLSMQSKVSKDQIRKMEEIQRSTENLDSTYFKYDTVYQKYVLQIQAHFPLESDLLMEATNENDREKLYEAGLKIRDFLADTTHGNTQYIIIIEGQASKDKAESAHNYDLSFRRARSLMEFWIDEKIDFGDKCEILISGSGDGTLKTESMKPSMRDTLVEANNQRFLVYVLPKNIINDAQKK